MPCPDSPAGVLLDVCLAEMGAAGLPTDRDPEPVYSPVLAMHFRPLSLDARLAFHEWRGCGAKRSRRAVYAELVRLVVCDPAGNPMLADATDAELFGALGTDMSVTAGAAGWVSGMAVGFNWRIPLLWA